MRGTSSIRIITKKFAGVVRRMDIWMTGIILLSALLRLYRLEALTEFLGDQGRTMLIMRDFLEDGVLPLAGPTTLSGHNLGPVFYYLLMPGYLIGGLTGVIYWVATLGIGAVYFLYKTVNLIYGPRAARSAGVLWAVSPFIIPYDRIIWEPSMVPLFVVLFLYLLYTAHVQGGRMRWVALGAVSGTLLQLHYPNVIFIGLTGLYFIGSAVFYKRKTSDILVAFAWYVAGFLLVLGPFLWYEYTVGFRDFRGVFSVILSGGGVSAGKRIILVRTMEYGMRVFGRALPMMSGASFFVLMALWGLFVWKKPTKMRLFLSVWLGLGLVAMARYSGVVYDHYLFFLVPVPFFMIGSVISSVRRPWSLLGVAIVSFLAMLQLSGSDINPPRTSDVSRLRSVTGVLLAESASTPFSFTLLQSRSYSDLHYRYFFRTNGLVTQPVTSDRYDRLYIICDRSDCPDSLEISKVQTVPVLCYDYHCSGSYPTIFLFRDWKLEQARQIPGDHDVKAVLYRFARK